MMVRLKAAHQSGVPSAVELLGEGELEANALVDEVNRRDHVVLDIGIVIQAVDESMKRRRADTKVVARFQWK
eukprot:2299527-Pleurochrysis_carterae.AAC.4